MPLTLREALLSATAALQDAEVDSPAVDARLLLQHVLRVDRTHCHAHPGRLLSDAEEQSYRELVTRRAEREPLPYLIGTWEFLGLPFRVTPAVLIPRPETETLVETVAARLMPGARILDVGTGTGCVAIGLAHLLPGAVVTSVDLSPEAAAVARENALSLDVADRVKIVTGPFPEVTERDETVNGPFDAVVSNPPYIPSEEVDRLAPEQREHEPRLALDGGDDGLDLVRELIRHSPRLLQPDGLLAMEIMRGQAPAVSRMLEAAGWRTVETINDLANVERVVVATGPPESV